MLRTIATEAFLANLPFFKGLGDAALARLAAGTVRHKLRRGACIFREGDVPTGLYAVVYGRIKLASHDVTGREVRADIVGAGHTFGEAVLFLERPCVVRATAASDALVLHIDKRALYAELERTPLLARRVIGRLAEQVEWLVRQRNELAIGSGAQRLVAWLLRRREVRSAEGEATLTLPATKRVLAAHLNLSAEHLSRVLRELTVAGLVRVHGRDMTIPDVRRLRTWQLGEGRPLGAQEASSNLSNRQGLAMGRRPMPRNRRHIDRHEDAITAVPSDLMES